MAKLNISELDFETIKAQFKDYLQGQTQFKDYNFDGSNMSVFLDVLAYNTYQNNFYANMAVNEMFLDSAVLKNSVMSHAKELNYLPRSRRSPRALVTVTITDPDTVGQTITIPTYSNFKTSFQGDSYNYTNSKTAVARKTAPGVFVAENIEIFEGEMLASFEREGYFIGDDGVLRVILTNENADTLENIRYFAPKSLQIQERAITTNDYEILLKQNFPEIKTVSAYGGEELDPPQFGRVAIAVYLGEGREGLSGVLSSTYIKFLKEKSPLGIEPVFIQSDFMYGCVNINTNFDPKVTKRSSGQIEVNIRAAITAYNTTYLDDFDATLRLSKLASSVDAADTSILSNEITVCPYVVYTPNLNQSASPSFKFYSKLVKPYPFKDSNGFADYKPAVVSGVFSYNNVDSYFQDDGLGNIQIVTSDIVNPQIVKPIAGSVDYATGEINLVGFKTEGFAGSGIRVMVVTANDDITAPAGRIFLIQDDDVTVNMLEVK